MSRRSITRRTSQVALALAVLGWAGLPSRAGEVKKSVIRAAAPVAKTIYTNDNAPATPELEDLPLNESVSQHGITWTFDKPARVGQFVTDVQGDADLVDPTDRRVEHRGGSR